MDYALWSACSVDRKGRAVESRLPTLKGNPNRNDFETYLATGFRLAVAEVSEMFTPPKFNMAPEEWWLEDEFPFGIVYFWGGMLNLRGVYYTSDK